LPLLDHLVGGEDELGRNLQAERFCGLAVDDQLELGRLDDRQVGRLGAAQDARRIEAGLAERVGSPPSMNTIGLPDGQLTRYDARRTLRATEAVALTIPVSVLARASARSE